MKDDSPPLIDGLRWPTEYVPNMHRQTCTDPACGGCFVAPAAITTYAREEGESVDAYRTRRNRELLDRGTHPATYMPLLDGDETCGRCSHHHAYREHNGLFHKCDLHRLGESHSAASDVRVSWPACAWFDRVTD